MLNHIVIMGRLTRDPELRTTQSGVSVTSFTVAVDRDFSGREEKQTDFIDCVAWRNTGEFVAKYFQKGGMIVVAGSLQSRKWQDRDGNKRVNWEINAEHCYFGEARREDSGASRTPPPTGRYGGTGRPVSVDHPESDGFYDMPPGTGYGNPFAGGAQTSFQDDGELPF